MIQVTFTEPPTGPAVQALEDHTFTQSEIVIGKSPDSDLRLDDSSVSSRHAIVTIVDDDVIIEDQGSVHGTRLNGEELKDGRAHVMHKDVLTIGNVELYVSISTVGVSDTSSRSKLRDHIRNLQDVVTGVAPTSAIVLEALTDEERREGLLKAINELCDASEKLREELPVQRIADEITEWRARFNLLDRAMSGWDGYFARVRQDTLRERADLMQEIKTRAPDLPDELVFRLVNTMEMPPNPIAAAIDLLKKVR